MKSLCLVTLLIGAVYMPVCIHPQVDMGSSGPKVFGSYSGGDITKIDLATGNLTASIPLISFPQIGKLPPLSFSADLTSNNFVQTETCDPDIDTCWVYYERLPSATPGPNIGPIFHTNMQGGQASDNGHFWIARWLNPGGGGGGEIDGDCAPPTGGGDTDPCGQFVSVVSPYWDNEYLFEQWIPNFSGAVTYGFTDSNGQNHVMASDSSNWNTFRTTDGSGYSFVPDAGQNLVNGWFLTNYFNPPGTAYGPTGLKSKTTIDASGNWTTTTKDPSGNTITRSNWNDYGNAQFTDSVGRVIPDVSSPYLHMPSAVGDTSKCPQLGLANQPATFTQVWSVPSMNGTTEDYTFCYTAVQYLTGFFGDGVGPDVGGVPGVWPQIQYQDTSNMPVNDGSPMYSWLVNTYDNQWPIQSIVLPDGTYWSFTYDVGCSSCDLISEMATAAPPPSTYGDITQIHYPSGATETFDYANVTRYDYIGPAGYILARVVKSVILNDEAGRSVTRTFDYLAPSTTPGSPGFGTTIEHDPIDGHYPNTQDAAHLFGNFGADPAYGTPSYYEMEADYYAGSYGTSPLLKKIQNQYQWQPELETALQSLGQMRATNVLPISTTTTTPAGVQSVVSWTYQPQFTAINVVCQLTLSFALSSCTQGPNPATGGSAGPTNVSYNVPVSETISDGAGNVLRQTITTPEFAVKSAYYNVNMLALPALTNVYGQPCSSSCTLAAQASYNYDEDNGSPQGLLGNQTSVTASVNLNAGSQTVTSSVVYNANGTPHLTKDANGNQTLVAYGTTCGGLFPQTVTKPFQSVTTAPETITYSYDCNTGLQNSVTDPNGVTTRYTYGTTQASSYLSPEYSFGRISQIAKAAGVVGEETHTTFTYPTGNEIDVAQDEVAVGDGLISGKTYYDGLFRPIKKIGADGATVITQYTSEGEVASVTNPYLTTGDPSYGVTNFTYDALGRKTIQTHEPDHSILQWCYDGIATDGQSNCRANVSGFAGGDWMDQEDESGNDRQFVSDSLGRLRTAVEPGSLLTNYGYDGLGNLTQVNQLGVVGVDVARTRSFSYDSLSRLLNSNNPESGSISYTYDANGNLITKTSPAPNGATGTITLGYCYDALNRMTFKFYSAPPSPGSCPTFNATAPSYPNGAVAAYAYDASPITGAANTVGKLIDEVTLSSGAVTSEYAPYAFDALGRLSSERQCPLGPCATKSYSLGYTYDLAGSMLTSTNGLPTADAHYLAMGYSYDNAGRLGSLTSSPIGSVPATTLFQANSYGSAGLLSAQMGGSAISPVLRLSRSYDDHMRLVSETDTGEVVSTAASRSGGLISVSGLELQGSNTGTAATGTLSIHHISPQASQICSSHPGSSSPTCVSVANAGSLSININGFTATVPMAYVINGVHYPWDPTTIIRELIAAFNTAGSPVSVVRTAGGGGFTLTMTSVAKGAATNYAYSIVDDDTDFSCEGDVGAGMTLAGGTGANSFADSGTVVVAVNHINSTPVPWGSSSNNITLASAVATAIRNAVGSLVTVTSPTPTTVQLSSINTGASTNFPVTVIVTDSTPGNASSFSVTGANMTGGADQVTTSGTVYSYNLDGNFAPNGNVMGYTDSVMGAWTFGYDNLNRLLAANGPVSQQLLYQYDSFGNKWVGGVSAVPAASVYSTPNNQPAAWVGQGFDAAGNMIANQSILGPVDRYVYDAENQLVSFDGSTGYKYDAEGRRVAKGNISGGVFTVTAQYLYGPSSGPVTELDGAGNWKHTDVSAGGRLFTYDISGLHYQLSDWLGTRRIQVSAAGLTEEQCQSNPFGDGPPCTGSDATERRYTGKERDAESGLDDFGARYYSSNMGRFMSPDSPGFAHLSNPQAWNLYSYTYNNPISSVDPDGHDVACTYNISQCVADANTATGANGQVVANTTVTHHSWLGGLIQFDTSVTKLGISGDEASFRALGQNASRLADLIDNHSFTLEVRYGPDSGNPGGSDSFLPSQGYSPLSIIDPSHSASIHDPDALDQYPPIPQANTAEEFGHEVLGHEWGELINGDAAGSRQGNPLFPYAPTTRANMRDSITGENAVRKLDPTRGQKPINGHHNYPDAPSDGYKHP
jgi:RHS repeat-associated protein